MNKIILMALCITLILLSGCSSYDNCKYDCYKINNCIIADSFCMEFDCPEKICTKEQIRLCYDECRLN